MKTLMHYLIAPVSAVFLVTACSIYERVYSDYDHKADFNKYRTFAWIPDSSGEAGEFFNTAYDNDIIRNNAKNYINHNLTRRGFVVSIDSPDLLVQLVLLNEKRERIVTFRNYPDRPYYFRNHFYYPYYYPYYRYYTWYGWNAPPFWYEDITSVRKTYVKGTITVNVYDRVEKRLIWTGSAEGDIYDPAYLKYDVHPAIDRILSKFPGKPKHKTNGKLPDHDRIAKGNGFELRNGGANTAGFGSK